MIYGFLKVVFGVILALLFLWPVVLFVGGLINDKLEKNKLNEAKKKNKSTGDLNPFYNHSSLDFPIDAQNSEPNPRFSGDSE